MKYLFIILLLISEFARCDTEYQDTPLIICYDPITHAYGIVIGVNKSNINHTIDNLSTNSNFGFNFGIQYNYSIGDSPNPKKNILFRASYVSNSIDYNFKNLEKDINDLKITENNKYLQLSSIYKFKFINAGFYNLHLLLGPYFNYILDDINSKNITIFNNKSFNKLEIGASVGIGFDYEFNDFIIGIEYNYMYAFTNKYTYKDDYIKNKFHFINFIFLTKY